MTKGKPWVWSADMKHTKLQNYFKYESKSN